MSSWPAPTGRPASMHPRPDPWGDELRRREERRQRRARRWRWVTLGLLAVGVVAAAAVVGARWGSNEESGDPGPLRSTSAAEATTTVAATTAPTTLPPSDLVSIDDIWLIEREGGIFDWGVTVVVPEGGGERADVDVTVHVVDADGVAVDSVTRGIDAISETQPAAVAGRLVRPATAPTRLEFDVSVGRPATEPGVAALLDVRAVTREDDVVSGRVRSAAAEEVTDVSIVFVWRAEDSDAVVASVIYAVERVRPGVDARFEVDVAGEDVPDGEPDATFLAP